MDPKKTTTRESTRTTMTVFFSNREMKMSRNETGMRYFPHSPSMNGRRIQTVTVANISQNLRLTATFEGWEK